MRSKAELASAVGSPKDPLVSPQPPLSGFALRLAVFASIGGALFGYDTGVVSGAILLISSHKRDCPKYGGFGLSNFEKEVFVDATIGGAIVGALMSGHLSDRIGRRLVIMLAAVLFTIGSVVLGFAPSLWVLVVGRFLVGVAIGFASHTTPMYLAEVGPPHVRGRLVSAFNMSIVFGQVLAGVLDGALFYLDEGWRYMLAFAALLSITQLIGFASLPESPRYLLQSGKELQARQVLSRIRPLVDLDEEIEQCKASIAAESDKAMSWGEIWRTESVRRALGVGVGLMFLQQFAGINTVMYYASTILQKAGFGGSDDLCCCHDDAVPIWLSAVTATAQAVGCIVGIFSIDRFGRRPCLLVSLTGVVLMLALLGSAFVFDSVSFSSELSLLGLIGYLLAFGIGMSGVPWVMNSEIYPTQARSRCLSLAVMTNWACNFIVAGTFLTISDEVGTGETFWGIGLIALVGLVWSYWAVPETLGRGLEDMQLVFT